MGAGGVQDAQTLQEGTHTSSRGENDDIHKYLIRQTQTAFPIHAGREARGAAPAVFGTPPPLLPVGELAQNSPCWLCL